MQTLGFSVSGVMAFGGIGGIAIGFAAKDLLANFFGALTIYLDRPFSEGDWIRSPDREIEGIVENIGWRLTVIRSFDKRPIYVPNSVFASIADLPSNPNFICFTDDSYPLIIKKGILSGSTIDPCSVNCSRKGFKKYSPCPVE